jgi:hypothetical protein
MRLAVRALDDILRRMQGHQQKKRSMMRSLSVAGAASGALPDRRGPSLAHSHDLPGGGAPHAAGGRRAHPE